jgi:hypothetical protein
LLVTLTTGAVCLGSALGQPPVAAAAVGSVPPPAAGAAAPGSGPGADATADEAPPPDEEPTPEEAAAPPPPASAPPLVVTGYVDVGYAKAQGDGTSFLPGDTRAPADYGVDTFAPAVNSRGEVASTDAGGRPINGFIPRSVGIGNTPSFLLNTASADLRYNSPSAPVMVFTRVQFLPRFEPTGDVTRLFLEQAFGRITPFRNAEFTVTVGKSDSVFGIEYLENQANFRVGITPSLLARYTTGQSIGVKLFYRRQLAAIGSSVTLNAAATNSPPFVEALQGPDRSLTGVPVGSARLGYELNLSRLSAKVGASASYGPRNDQVDREAYQRMWGVDWRLFTMGLTVSGEIVSVDQDEGSADGKLTGTGMYPFPTAFFARGLWTQAAYELPLPLESVRLTPYGRYEQRHAGFQGFIPMTVDRITFGLNVGLYDNVQIKGEVLINRELEGAPVVANNVYTSSAVWTW